MTPTSTPRGRFVPRFQASYESFRCARPPIDERDRAPLHRPSTPQRRLPASSRAPREADLTILVTGAAGFIGYHVARRLLERGTAVLGIDNLNDYYDVSLKNARLAELRALSGFDFRKVDIADHDALDQAVGGERFDAVIHLAAQAGVRASLDHPHLYVSANVTGHLNILEVCRRRDPGVHIVYASSSSVYGNNDRMPFAESDRVELPASLYAVTKRTDELMSYAYGQLYGQPTTGLRFFTVYGPWGRPDMAVWRFTEAILAGRPITLYNRGRMKRDFTYIDDIAEGVIAVADGPVPTPDANGARIYNIGNNRSEELRDLVAAIEAAAGREAIVEEADMQPGDVVSTHADISRLQADYGYRPRTTIAEGIPRFVDWYRAYNGG